MTDEWKIFQAFLASASPQIEPVRYYHPDSTSINTQLAVRSFFGDGTWEGFLKQHDVTEHEKRKLRTFLCTLRLESALRITA